MDGFVVIFDMDGVIVNSEPIHQECERELFHKLNITLTQKEHDRFLGVSGSDMWKQIVEKFDLNESAEQLVEIQNSCFIHKLENLKPLPIIEGVMDLIQYLSDKHVMLMLASSSLLRVVDKVLILSGIKNYFNYIVSGSDVINSKPSPDIFFRAAKTGGVNTDQCIVIEDSENGIKAARQAGMKVIGFLNGFNSEESIRDADLIVSDFSEISMDTLIKLKNIDLPASCEG